MDFEQVQGCLNSGSAQMRENPMMANFSRLSLH
jgi:hypothetical protein